jgi:hypothetical protein
MLKWAKRVLPIEILPILRRLDKMVVPITALSSRSASNHAFLSKYRT